MPRFAGHQTYLRVAKEATYGSLPGTPTWISIYGRDDDYYDVRATFERMTLNTNVGSGVGLIHVIGLKQIRGGLRTWVMPGQAAILDWATKVTNDDLDSFTADFFDGVRYVRHTGLKVARATIRSGANIDAQPIQLEYELVGQDQLTQTAWSEPFMQADRPYLFTEASITIDGTTNTKVEEYTITIENTLAEGRGTQQTIPWLRYTGRRVTCTFTIPYEDTTLLDKFEAGTLISFKAVHTHAVAGKTLTLDLQTRVVLTDVNPRRPLRDVGRITVNLEALATSATGTDFTVTEA